MSTLTTAFYTLKNKLQTLYEDTEAAAITHELLTYITGLSKYERLVNKDQTLTTEQLHFYNDASQRLLNGEPLQYITGIQWFMGKPFEVNKNVLIPRPETEELVQWIVNDCKYREAINILDIGTGSGCIPIMLKLLLPNATVCTADVSSKALEAAERNALKHNVEIELLEVDFLDERTWEYFEQYDIIVSNPPYIPFSEKGNLDKNVRDYEPELALFVPNNDVLIFYKKIAHFTSFHLKAKGAVYCEIHKAHAYETQQLFQQQFFFTELRKDMNANERMIKAWNEK